ncbi:hypothetical protein [Marinoscillum sp. 108]|uniref:hypothetical protein n=1 Tax=Marinoscillum sp. 108 TaxID=2653151 RepID=UPI001358CAA3|nr:hypothetical protein [Marinoscillum sp. 108]
MTRYRHCEYPDGNRRRSNPPIAILYVVCTYLTILPHGSLQLAAKDDNQHGSLRKPAPMTNREVGMLWLCQPELRRRVKQSHVTRYCHQEKPKTLLRSTDG